MALAIVLPPEYSHPISISRTGRRLPQSKSDVRSVIERRVMMVVTPHPDSVDETSRQHLQWIRPLLSLNPLAASASCRKRTAAPSRRGSGMA